jgi:hypothetical protein
MYFKRRQRTFWKSFIREISLPWIHLDSPKNFLEIIYKRNKSSFESIYIRQRTFWIVNIIITFCNVNVVVSK